MANNEIKRIRTDLEIIEQAAGIKQEITWEWVWMGLGFGTVCLLFAGATLFLSMPFQHLLAGFLFLIFFGILVVHSARVAQRGREEAVDHHTKFFSVSAVVMFICLFGYLAWEEKFAFPEELFLGFWFLLQGIISAMEFYPMVGWYGVGFRFSRLPVRPRERYSSYRKEVVLFSRRQIPSGSHR